MRRAPTVRGFLIALLVCLANGHASNAQFPFSTPADLRDSVYLNVDSVAKSHLLRAEAYLGDGQWAEAVDILQQVMDESGEKLIELGPSHFTNVRAYCHRLIAGFPPEALAEYRSRVDPQAESWYRDGLAQRDSALLRNVVDMALASSWGDDALNLLAELSLERGEYARARSYWEQILPLPADEEANVAQRRLAYPDTALPLAEIRAKIVLAGILAGRRDRARAELQRFTQMHPDAEGTLLGRKGPYRESLAEFLSESNRWLPREADGSWTTFAGAPARTKCLPRAVDVGAWQWERPLKAQQGVQVSRTSRMRFRPPTVAPGEPTLSYHPLLVDDLVLVNDDRTISAYNVDTGEPAWPGINEPTSAVIFSVAEEPDVRSRAMARRIQAIGVPQFTMTVADGRLFARMGYPIVAAAASRRNFAAPSQPGSIVCLDLSAQGKLLWEKRNGEEPIANSRDDWAFEGTPVADSQCAYVAVRRNSGFMPEAHVVCYDAETGEKRWERLVCQGSSPTNGQLSELSHNLLTLADGTLYYCTNLGAVAALDARDGQVRWIVTYPRSSATPWQGQAKHFERELNPCVVSDGTVLAAPSDTPLVMALDADTGQLRWQTELLEDVVHLLGVGQGNLIATGDQVWAVDLQTGKVVWHWPDASHEPNEHGRGVLVSNEVYWPLKDEIVVLRQADGALVRRIPLIQQHGETGGNLLVANGYLLIAQEKALVAFSQYSRLFDRYEKEIAARPNDAEAHFHFARAAEATERWELAARSYRRAKELASAEQQIDGSPLSELAASRLYHLLVNQAEASAEQHDWDRAVQLYQDAARDAPGPSQRLSALMRTAEVWGRAEKPSDAVAAYQAVLAEPGLRSERIAVSDTLRLRCDLLVAERIADLIKEHGRGVYAAFDEQATEQLARIADHEDDPAALEETVARYPNAEVASQVLVRLAGLYQKERRPEQAARVYGRLLYDGDTNVRRSEVLFSLARVYEQQGLWARARDTWKQLAESFPEADLASVGVNGLAAAFVAQTLAESPYTALRRADRVMPVGLPLARRWEKHLAGARVLIPEGESPDLAPQAVYVADDGLECLAVDNGRVQWSLETSGPPVWLGYAGEHLLVASERAVMAVYASNGAAAWQWTNDSAAKPATAEAQSETSELPLRDFALAGSRVIFREGTRRIAALDTQTGSLVWRFQPKEGILGAHFRCEGETLTLQSTLPGRMYVLETDDGRVRYERNSGEASWPRAPLHFDALRTCVVEDRVRVAMYDARRGGMLWELNGPSSPANGPPEVLGNGKHLLAVLNGYELCRINPATGDVVWRRLLGTEPLANPRQQMTLDSTAAFCVSRGELKAFRLSDGELIWNQRVGTQGAWRVERLSEYVVCYPAGNVAATTGAMGELGASVLVYDAEKGTPVEQMNFSGAEGSLNVNWIAGAAVVADDENLWVFGTLSSQP